MTTHICPRLDNYLLLSFSIIIIFSLWSVEKRRRGIKITFILRALFSPRRPKGRRTQEYKHTKWLQGKVLNGIHRTGLRGRASPVRDTFTERHANARTHGKLFTPRSRKPRTDWTKNKESDWLTDTKRRKIISQTDLLLINVMVYNVWFLWSVKIIHPDKMDPRVQ